MKRGDRFWQHNRASVADLTHHAVQTQLERGIVVLIRVPEAANASNLSEQQA